MTTGETVLGRYALGERLAAGSLGTVVAATDLRTGRAVAVKFFDGAHDNFGAWVDELRLALRLTHPQIVPCLDVGHDREFGLSVMVFPRALGGSLRRAMAAGRVFTTAEQVAVVRAIALALAHAHGHGVVHRDVKPENILALERTGEPPWALTDFGAGRFLARGAALGSLAGSRPYMAPEVGRGAADARSDQYSLGVVALELLLNRRPELAERTAFRLGAGAGMPAVAARLLDPDPRRRFPDCVALAAALASLPGDFDVGWLADGRWVTLAGDQLRSGEAEGLRWRVPRARRFVHEADETTAVVCCDRRLVELGERATTMLAVEGELAAFVVSRARGAAWLRCGERLVVSDLAGAQTGARVPMPEEWGRPGPTAPLCGVTLGREAALLGLRGSASLLLVERVGRGLQVRELRAPAPVYALLRGEETALVHCGDEHGGGLCELGAGELRVLERGQSPVDCQRLATTGPPRLMSLLEAPALEEGP